MTQRVILLVLILLMPLSGGCQCAMQCARELKAQTTGLHRKVQLFDYSGRLVGAWESRTVIDNDQAGHAEFFDSAGRRVTILGGIMVSTEDAK